MEYKNKFNIANPSQAKKYGENDFFNWTNNNFYRTSYHDMSSPGRQVLNKNHVVPGYRGFVPKVKAQGIIGKTATEASRKAFNAASAERASGYSSTGFNASRLPKHDCSLQATSNRYGKRTNMDYSPAQGAERYDSTEARDTMVSPKKTFKPNWRGRHNSMDMDMDGSPSNDRSGTKASGFVMNSTLFDGTSWQTEKNLHSEKQHTF